MLNALDHFRMACFMNLKGENIASMIFMFYLHHVVESVVCTAYVWYYAIHDIKVKVRVV